MLFLMLDPRFKTFHLVSSFIGREQSNAIVEEYDKLSLFFMLIKCYYHLHLLVEFERSVIVQRVVEDVSLDIFEIIVSTSELTMELVNKKLLIFKCYQVNVKDIKCPLQRWEKHESMFPIIGLAFVLDKS
jgi:hypothetical protein